ncbi:uncharacterized protein LOC101449327 [Ceratitis capitata]|uniref:uncharacterized protein LOC101449327 n=1 Tax=Ceratitis capitata TaxID=7213 RepID=UPI00032A0550|nr:uncharacterized protein LOC101449327 [Ceratitis capitata]
MQSLAFTTLFTAIIANTVAVPLSASDKATADNGILNLLVQTNALGGNANSEITTECFNYYMPILNQISLNFSVQYEQCIGIADQAAARLSSTAAKHRARYVNETAATCNTFTLCNSKRDTLDFFNCYATAATADINKFNNLSDNASNVAISLKTGLQQIEFAKDICTSGAQHTYTMRTSENYKELYACFANGLPKTSTPSTNFAVN